ncbi:L,D-transpeptidase family protein [Phenylobacterium immobile]|uniref:L,D-transpeptidase family protein n=1 Tax=Phenylobacterium immobile TaxID=21 RepID=UPI000A472C22|nr:L,D-transpeptidase family protein [Phenylobacterium immobile]
MFSRRGVLVGGALSFGAGLAHAQTALPVAPIPYALVSIPELSRGQIAVALKVLGDADLQGLKPRDYLSADFPTEASSLNATQMTTLTAALARYAKDVRVGRLTPDAFPSLWGVRPALYDARSDLAQAVSEDRLQAFLDKQPPTYSGYHALRRSLARYRAMAKSAPWPMVPEGPNFGLGERGARVAALRKRLAAEDDKIVGGSDQFDQPLQDALVRAQRRFGFRGDGVADAPTLAALNQPIGQRILQIVANMERWRWLPRQMPATRVQVNSGAAIVTLFRDDAPVLSMKAVSGRPGDETPMLWSNIHSVVINPPWNVPTSIATKELWPKERANPGYLSRNGFVVIKTEGGGSRLQQRAGDMSALGRFKFDFANDYAVYLHDTPSRGGFDRISRQASHGCVRIEKPAELARALLEGDPVWTPEKIEETLASGKTVRAQLPQETPVFIFYWTAFAGADGQMHFRSDPYDWDRQLLQKVGVVASGAQV